MGVGVLEGSSCDGEILTTFGTGDRVGVSVGEVGMEVGVGEGCGECLGLLEITAAATIKPPKKIRMINGGTDPDCELGINLY